jgi:hypothetical protein
VVHKIRFCGTTNGYENYGATEANMMCGGGFETMLSTGTISHHSFESVAS